MVPKASSPRLARALAPATLSRIHATLVAEKYGSISKPLRAATIGAATVGGQEHERGSLRPGKRADLVILNGDLDADSPPTVAETWVAGERVYTAPEPRSS